MLHSATGNDRPDQFEQEDKLKAKSETSNAGAGTEGQGGKPRRRTQRMPYDERRAQILEKAAQLFAEHGIGLQTRALAAECGISQRLLYRFFPTKDDLLREVYDTAILGPFKVRWFADLSDRTRPMDDRLHRFYIEYLDTVLDRRWLRLFLYASLAEADMAPNYISSIITKLMETIVTETAQERDVTVNMELQAVHELGWTLHGAISHYAIRRHVYGASQVLAQDQVVSMHVRIFLTGFEAMVEHFEKAAA